MNASVVYGMLVDSKDDSEILDNQLASVYKYTTGRIIIPNEEAAMIPADQYVPKLIEGGTVDVWDRAIDSFCKEKGISISKKGWWLLSHP